MTVTLREARPDDANRVRDLHIAAIEGLDTDAYDDEQVAAWAHDREPESYPIESAETHFVVAEADDRQVGFGWLQTKADGYAAASVDGELTAVYVHPSAARQGVGSRIRAELEAAARGRGIDKLGLWASKNAVPFYEAAGYRRVTDHTVEFDDGVSGTVVEMIKHLDDPIE